MHLTSKILFVVGLLAIVALARPEHRDASHSDESTEGDKDRMINRCLFGGIPCSDNLVCLPFDWRCLVDPSCSDRHGSCVPKPPHWDKKSEADEMQKDMKKERDESLTDNELEEIKFVLKEHQPKPYHDDDLTICPGEHVLTATGGDPILSHSSYVQLTTEVEKPFAHYTPIRKIDEDEKGVKSCVVRTLSESYSGCPVEIMIGVRSSTVCRYYALQLKDENA
ncbi:hypothetical protein PRIPAC_87038, partial [Pristionchus pacificus]|uniref:Uncharacterized protein n=1 Tax=Pristionchus pacificus TaxID=54126 RepID=A0A2A6BTW4_PRIPA